MNRLTSATKADTFVPINHQAGETPASKIAAQKLQKSDIPMSTLSKRVIVFASCLAFFPVLKIVLLGFAVAAFVLSPLNIILLAAFALALLISIPTLIQKRGTYTFEKACKLVLTNLFSVALSFITVPISIIKFLAEKKADKSESEKPKYLDIPRTEPVKKIHCVL